jgi:enamine deaminase RidA (YjgF/YER057c/UK114 family)
MSIKRIHPTLRLAEAVVHNHTVYLAGQVPTTLGADIASQTREVLTAIDYALAQCATDKSNLLSATIYLADLGDYDVMNKVWDEWVAYRDPGHRGLLRGRVSPCWHERNQDPTGRAIRRI